MKSLFRSIIARVSSSVKAQTTAAVDTAPPVLGRWGIQYDEKIIARKIVQANEDHCGCCVVAENPKKNKNMVQYEKTEEYLVPYVM